MSIMVMATRTSTALHSLAKRYALSGMPAAALQTVRFSDDGKYVLAFRRDSEAPAGPGGSEAPLLDVESVREVGRYI